MKLRYFSQSELEVNVLIPGDCYWSLFTSKIVRGEIDPVAMETLLGCVLSGNTGVRGSKYMSVRMS